MSVQNWRFPTNVPDRINHMDKRLMNEERRPIIAQASDLLGPGSAPFAVAISDWNEDAASFVGVFCSAVSEVDGAPVQVNSPNNSLHWMGETFGTDDGYGFQRLTRFRFSAETGSGASAVWMRRFYSPGGIRLYSEWTAA